MNRAHIIGAGLAGLSCAVRLAEAGVPAVLYEQAARAGGRCRSFHDAALDCVIDNGNHLLLSGNRSALGFLETVGARDRLVGPEEARFPFLDLATGERWTVAPNRGPLPWWVLSPSRRAPGTGLGDHLAGLKLLTAGPGATVGDALSGVGPAALARFWEPLIVAVLNMPVETGAARLMRPVLLETFAKGADACRPLIARDSLSDSFVDPALAWLEARGTTLRPGTRVMGLDTAGGRVRALRLAREEIAVGPDEAVIVAVPAWLADSLVPGIETPGGGEPIVNVHYRLSSPPDISGGGPVLGLVGGLAQWLFVRGDVASVTISAAAETADRPADAIAGEVWREVAQALSIASEPVPRWRVVKERRATFGQTPEAVSRRPQCRTTLDNAFLAGDWTDTGLPATIESAIRSGEVAAHAALDRRA
ncbi:FAD-dependent oxidoreductase [Kaustia mangrovi]|uniref:FAD-dependent oxidoreductase n=1 Tax=Kaustia mangrovi TaxID=2593653 RepID=A0A7S8C6S4_9HYPH|nr:hydroxysqualene dehydroxylase HpnE [Kaustia mangrovi]QPC44417.1 FAD-dependent oxidoreductase [Kaustia mangrovi]